MPGPDGILTDDPIDGVDESADDAHENTNTTTPFVDQNQTYTSHPVAPGVPARLQARCNWPSGPATGKLITNRTWAPTAICRHGRRRHEIGGMATWAVVKAQARDILGINLTDANVFDVPLLCRPTPTAISSRARTACRRS